MDLFSINTGTMCRLLNDSVYDCIGRLLCCVYAPGACTSHFLRHLERSHPVAVARVSVVCDCEHVAICWGVPEVGYYFTFLPVSCTTSHTTVYLRGPYRIAVQSTRFAAAKNPI